MRSSATTSTRCRSTGRSPPRSTGLRRNRGETRRITEAMEALRPGDVVVVRRKGGRVAVLSHEHRRGGGSRLVALTPGRDVVRLGPAGLRRPAAARREHRPAHAVRAPQPVVPAPDRRPPAPGEAPRRHRSLAPRRAPARRARDRAGRAPARRRSRSASRSCGRRGPSSASNATSSAPSAACGAAARAWPASSTACCACWRRGATSTAGSSPTTGEQLARLYTETDLLLAEALREGLLDGLRPPELAALVSCFTYERRGPDGQDPMPPARWPTKTRRQAGARDRAHRPGPARQRGRRRPPRDPRARSRVHAVRARLGRRATRWPTCSTTTR